MDKEAQEKIEDSIGDLADIIQANEEYTSRGSFILAREIYEAGYHKPLDRPEEEEKIAKLTGVDDNTPDYYIANQIFTIIEEK